jgi:AraC-like DNA-binding protein
MYICLKLVALEEIQNVQFILKNRVKGIYRETFEPALLCPGISIIGVLDCACGIRSEANESHIGLFEIHYIAKGFQMFLVNGSFVSLHAGEFLVTLPGQIHSAAHDIINPSTIYWVQIPAELSSEFPAKEYSLITSHLKKISGQVCIEKKPLFCHLLNRIIDLLESGLSNSSNRIVLKSLSRALISDLLSIDSHEPRNNQDTVIIKKVYETIKKINNAPELPYKIPSVSKECRMGETLFRRVFKQITGFSPIDYIHFTRTEKAKKLLMKGFSVTAIAYEMGYSSSPHFCRTFSRWAGITPSSYQSQKNKQPEIITLSSEKQVYARLYKLYGPE